MSDQTFEERITSEVRGVLGDQRAESVRVALTEEGPAVSVFAIRAALNSLRFCAPEMVPVFLQEIEDAITPDSPDQARYYAMIAGSPGLVWMSDRPVDHPIHPGHELEGTPLVAETISSVIEIGGRQAYFVIARESSDPIDLPEAAKQAIGTISKAAARAAFTAELTTIDGESEVYGAVYEALREEVTAGKNHRVNLDDAREPAAWSLPQTPSEIDFQRREAYRMGYEQAITRLGKARDKLSGVSQQLVSPISLAIHAYLYTPDGKKQMEADLAIAVDTELQARREWLGKLAAETQRLREALERIAKADSDGDTWWTVVARDALGFVPAPTSPPASEGTPDAR